VLVPFECGLAKLRLLLTHCTQRAIHAIAARFAHAWKDQVSRYAAAWQVSDDQVMSQPCRACVEPNRSQHPLFLEPQKLSFVGEMQPAVELTMRRVNSRNVEEDIWRDLPGSARLCAESFTWAVVEGGHLSQAVICLSDFLAQLARIKSRAFAGGGDRQRRLPTAG